ncbi:MAG: hypothetical protein RL748_718, partial [Pseudomonadota bacterium]
GKGSCFSFALPHCQSAASQRGCDMPDALRHAPCLVLGPDRLGRTILLNNLRALCQQVVAVEQEAQALAEYQRALQQQQPYRFLLVGEMQSGVNLCQAIEQQGWLAPHAILLSHVEQANEHPCFSQIVYKPLIFSRLRQSLLLCMPGPNNHENGGPRSDRSEDTATSLAEALVPASVHVLVAEDNDINQEIAVELLAEQGMLVDIAIDGQHVLNKLRAVQAPPYRIIFMDLEMPVLDGLSTTRLIRQDARFNHIPIIAMTAHVLADMQQQCLADGMQDYLAKPINPQRVAEILQRWLRADWQA